MPVSKRDIAIAVAMGLPVYRLSSLRFAQRRDGTIAVLPTYEFRDADVDRLIEIQARFAGPMDQVSDAGRS